MKIYVVTHKKYERDLPENYEYIQVNSKDNKIYNLTDSTGDNISEKNPFFCELTAAYWIWKNDKENDVVGLSHYRRFLITNKFSSSIKKYVNEKEVNKKLQKYDIISTKLYKTIETVKQHMLINVHEKDYNILRETIKRLYPEYLCSFDNVMLGHKTYLLNMFICKKELFDEYYEWLFNILFEMEKQVDMTGYTVQEKRLYGFLSERLFTVYVLHNNLKVCSYSTYITEVSKLTLVIDKLKKIFK